VTITGSLYLVSTPLGNLSDMTYRAVETLRQVDLIACEDTRTSQTLLSHFDIHKPLVSYHNFNERKITEKLIRRLEDGENIALISDAGTPSISDPGFIIVREAVARGITIVPIPGPSAVITALAISGLPTDAFIFYGFLPQTQGKRRSVIASLADRRETIIIYESPFKIHKLIDLLHEILGSRRAVLCRELTKKFEEIIRADLNSLREQLSQRVLKGEITLVIEGKTRESERSDRAT
jgi:16S rRNA (cytidine1402-2'-O)-methyltransferase